MTNSQQGWVKCMFPFHHSESQEVFPLPPPKSKVLMPNTESRPKGHDLERQGCSHCVVLQRHLTTVLPTKRYTILYVYKLIYHVASGQSTITVILT